MVIPSYPYSQRLAGVLTSLGFQTEVANSQQLKVWGLGDRSRSEIWKASSQCGVLIQCLEEAKTSLEQTFLEIVSDVQHANT